MKKIDRTFSASKYIAIITITILVFILGILLGNYIAYSKLGQIEKTQQKLMAELIGSEIQSSLVKKKDICNLTWEELWKEKVEMGAKVTMLERRLGKENEDVLIQKEIYHLIEIRTLLLSKEIKKECDKNFTIILFFYTNKKNDPLGDWRESEDQGYVLGTLYEEDPENIIMLVFDINIINPALTTLKNIYKIEKVPSLVINEKKYEGFKNAWQLKKILKNETV